MARILIIEDEQDLAGLLEYNLRAAGFETEAVGTGASGLARARATPPDLVLLDLMLPDLGGAEVLRLFKNDAELRRVPVIIVSAKGQESDRVRGLSWARTTTWSSPSACASCSCACGRCCAARTRRKAPRPSCPPGTPPGHHAPPGARRHGQEVVLTALEFRLLRTLLEREGRVQTREVLLSDVWGIQADITRAPWTRTSSGCARSSAPRATSSRRCAAWATSSVLRDAHAPPSAPRGARWRSPSGCSPSSCCWAGSSMRSGWRSPPPARSGLTLVAARSVLQRRLDALALAGARAS